MNMINCSTYHTAPSSSAGSPCTHRLGSKGNKVWDAWLHDDDISWTKYYAHAVNPIDTQWQCSADATASLS